MFRYFCTCGWAFQVAQWWKKKNLLRYRSHRRWAFDPRIRRSPRGVNGNSFQYSCCSSVQFSSVAHSCPTLCNPTDWSTPGLPVHHQSKFMSIKSVMPSNISSSVIPFFFHLESLPASGAFQMSQFFTSGSQLLEFQLQHQSFQWIFRTDFL